MVAHHEDDADENRLAELGKGWAVENTESLELHKSCHYTTLKLGVSQKQGHVRCSTPP